MEVSRVALSALFLAAILCIHSASSHKAYPVADACCVSYSQKRIPLNRVASFSVSNSGICSKPGVMFITVRGLITCANPGTKWVQQYMKQLTTKRAMTTPLLTMNISQNKKRGS
ncbi:C-C motif chemokine 3-like 1 [Ornithorhynchus anatinus]|uniref:C-C motif chemokine 3-like 1 n=1 Tax=Ornithorhynchus anatinus TaxID=9258 RepID=UPI0010A871EA|nr:C-C motif chemokine 3-like 1 [Ornithorhynchus anatinus]